jgi:tetratricopeptide (TPR) repeat protein
MRKPISLFLLLLLTAGASAQSRQENYQKAQDLMRDNKDKKAIDHLTKCISKDNTHAEYFYLRSTACMNIGDGQGALRDMDFAIKFGPDSAKYYYQRGRIYLLYRRPPLTIKDANEGLKVSKLPKTAPCCIRFVLKRIRIISTLQSQRKIITPQFRLIQTTMLR